MEKNTGKYNKATLIAAALIITGSTAIFGTYASGFNNEDPIASDPNPFACSAHELSDTGDFTPPMPHWSDKI
jgi:hypothetical protein